MQLCTWDSNLRLHLVVKDILQQLETSTVHMPSSHHEMRSVCRHDALPCKSCIYVSCIYICKSWCTDYQNRALTKYLELLSLDVNRETSELTDGEIYKYNQQNYEMLKDREERSTTTTKLILRGAILIQTIPSVLPVMQKYLRPIFSVCLIPTNIDE